MISLLEKAILRAAPSPRRGAPRDDEVDTLRGNSSRLRGSDRPTREILCLAAALWRVKKPAEPYKSEQLRSDR